MGTTIWGPTMVSEVLMKASAFTGPRQIAYAWLVLALIGLYLSFFFNISVVKDIALSGSIFVCVCGIMVDSNKTWRWNFWLANAFKGWIVPLMFTALEEVLKKATRGDAASVLKVIDNFCWDDNLLMNVGDIKGPLVDTEIIKKNPKVAVELGAHIGYSTVRFAACLEVGAKLYSVDPEPTGHAIKMSLLEHAGLSNRVVPVYDFSDVFLRKCASDGIQIDFLFIDHVKDLYLPDLQLCLELKILAPGCVVVADNVLMPGAPEYKAWVLGSKLFDSRVVSTLLEYHKDVKDELLVSVFKG